MISRCSGAIASDTLIASSIDPTTIQKPLLTAAVAVSRFGEGSSLSCPASSAFTASCSAA